MINETYIGENVKNNGSLFAFEGRCGPPVGVIVEEMGKEYVVFSGSRVESV